MIPLDISRFGAPIIAAIGPQASASRSTAILHASIKSSRSSQSPAIGPHTASSGKTIRSAFSLRAFRIACSMISWFF